MAKSKPLPIGRRRLGISETAVVELLKKLEGNWALAAGVAAALSVCILIGVHIWKAATSDEGSLLWLRWKKSAELAKTQEALREVTRDSNAKSRTIAIARLFAADMSLLFASQGDWRAPLGRLYQSLVSGIPKALSDDGFHRCGILVPVKGGRELRFAYGDGYSERGLKQARFPIDGTCAGRAFSTGSTYYCRDTREDPNFRVLPEATHPYRSFLCVPIKSRNETLGILQVDAEGPSAFNKTDQVAMQLFSNQVAILFELERILSEQEDG